MLLGGRATDQGHELVEPGVVLEQHVQVEGDSWFEQLVALVRHTTPE